MSKKLLTGVLTLSILLIGSTAIFSALPDGKRIAQPLPTSDPSAQLFGQEGQDLLAREMLQRESFVRESLNGLIVTKTFVPTFVCADQDNTDYANGFFGFSSFRDGWIGIVERMANKFIVPANFLCSLKTATVWVGAIDGSIDLEVGVWTGAGGLPTTQVASLIVPSASLTASALNTLNLAGFGLAFTQDYFVSYGTVAASAADQVGFTDRVQLVFDNGADVVSPAPRTGLTFSSVNGGWFENGNFWAGNAFALAAFVEECCEEIPFTNCFLNSHAPFAAIDANFLFASNGNCKAGYAMRYTTGGFDTLLVAEINVNAGAGIAPDGEMILEILADDGAGLPDPSSPLAPSLTVGGLAAGSGLYPNGPFAWIDYPVGPLVLGPGSTYHISVRWIGPDPATGQNSAIFAELGGDVQNFASVWFPDGVIQPQYACGIAQPLNPKGWFNYFGVFGVSRDFEIDINVCNDEFIDCELIESAASFSFISTFLETEGFTGFSGLYGAGGDECRVDFATVYFHKWEDITGLEVGIYSDVAGAPGSALYSEIIPSSAFTNPSGVAGTQTQTIFPNGGTGIQIVGGYHVVARPQFTGSGLGLYRLIIDNGSGGVRGHYEFGGTWFPSDAVFANGNSYFTESFRCCVPFNERACVPGEDWPTYQHDQQRTGASFNALGEANCNLNLLWSATSDKGNSFSGSVIFGDKVLISDDGGMDCRLLATGALVWDQNTNATVSGLFNVALGVRTQPTVAVIAGIDTSAGIATGPESIALAFLGTGLNRDVVAVVAGTGKYVWHNTTNAPFPGLAPNAENVKSIVLNDGFDDILFYATGNKVYAVLAATGSICPFWAVNPFVMVAENVNALSTNDAGFFSSQIVSPVFSGAIPGDIYSLDAASGTLLWSLSGVTGNVGLQAAVEALDGYINNEGFFSGASYDVGKNVFWANSYFDADFPEEGFLYRIDASGAVGAYSTAKSVRSRRATPVIDENQIYVPAFTKWLNPAITGEQIFSRNSGSFVQNMEGNIAADRQYNDGVLTCEPGVDDYYIHGTELGQLNFYQVGLINSLQFYRTTSLSGFGGGQWASGSLAPDVVVFTNFGGITVALGPGANRPRLTLPVDRQDLPIPFGTPNGFDGNFPAVIGNSGCADLSIVGITFTNPSPPSGTPIEFSAVDPALRAKMDERATFTTNSRLFMKMGLMYGEAPSGFGPTETYTVDNTVSSSLSFSAAVLPDVVDGTSGLNGLLAPLPGALIAPGDVSDLHVAINGPNVTRGPHDFTAHVDTDDPDYVMDNPAAIPTVALRVIGGCLEDSVTLTFGIGGANSAIVFNDALVQHFNNAGNNSLDIDGFDTGSEFFGGIRGWSLTVHRMGWTGEPWDFTGAWQTILAEENYCTNTCLPTLKSDALLGRISNDNGATYTDVFGDLIGLTYLDSARDYGNPWDWQSNPDPFLPDSTIGLLVDETHYGTKDVLGLANVQLVRLDVTNRSAVNSITDLQHFAVHDDDLNGTQDHMVGGAAFGYIFGEFSGNPDLHGYGTVGYGCNTAPNFRGRACDGGLFMFNTEQDPGPFDSIYIWGRDPIYAGITAQDGMEVGGSGANNADGESYYNFGGVDLAPSETKTIGLFHFAFSGSSDAAVYDGDPLNAAQFEGMADLVNKWAGFGRGDVNNDQLTDFADVVYLVGGGNPYPFEHLGDVNNDGVVDAADGAYLVDYYFNCGPCPVDGWQLALCTP